MKNDQKAIYPDYITGESKAGVQASPFLDEIYMSYFIQIFYINIFKYNIYF